MLRHHQAHAYESRHCSIEMQFNSVPITFERKCRWHLHAQSTGGQGMYCQWSCTAWLPGLPDGGARCLAVAAGPTGGLCVQGGQ